MIHPIKAKSVLPAMALGLAVTAAFPAAAQDRDSHFNGPYVQGVVGMATRGNDNGSTLIFDNNGDGDYDNTVNTAARSARASVVARRLALVRRTAVRATRTTSSMAAASATITG